MADITIQRDQTPAQLLAQIDTLLDAADPPLTLMANLASLLYWSLDAVNWVGFYLLDDRMLRLGPFHGKPACTAIALGHGVCGTAAEERRVLNVPDVLLFPGHIACDATSRSELVIPMIVQDQTGTSAGETPDDLPRQEGRLIGVLDLDSPTPGRFDQETQELIVRASALLLSRCGSRDVFTA